MADMSMEQRAEWIMYALFGNGIPSNETPALRLEKLAFIKTAIIEALNVERAELAKRIRFVHKNTKTFSGLVSADFMEGYQQALTDTADGIDERITIKAHTPDTCNHE